MPQTCDKPEKPKLLPGRRPIIQIAEKQILQPPEIVTEPKTITNIWLKEKSIFLVSSVHELVQHPEI